MSDSIRSVHATYRSQLAARDTQIAELEKARGDTKTRDEWADLVRQNHDLTCERDSSRALLKRARKFLGVFPPESDQNLLADIAAALEMSGGVLLSEWQPIETAPKDGTPILLTIAGRVLQPDEDTHCGIGRWQDDFWGNPSWCMDAGDFWPGATHWQTLPEPPR